MSDIEGAGKLDSKNAIYVAGDSNYTYGYLSASDFPYTETFYVSASDDQVRVALCWLKQCVINSGSHTVTGNIVERGLSDLDLEIFDPNGTRVSYSMTENGNVEIAEFDPQVSGNYTINVKRYTVGSNVNLEYVYLAWW